MSFLLRQAANKLWIGKFSRFEQAGICHGVATRMGGVSSAPYRSLNLSLRSGDQLENVLENRRRFYAAAAVEPDAVVSGRQVHSDHIAVVTGNERGRGALAMNSLPATDGLITAEPGIPLMIFFADCVPVLFFDPKNRVIGGCHAGWRGTASGIAAKTVLAMQQHFGTNPADCLAAIGPSIGPCCYEVDEPVVSQFAARFSWGGELFTPHGEGHWLIDLWQANQRQLQEIGVPGEQIDVSQVCTACHKDLFYSYRAEQGHIGLLAAIISL